MKNIKSPITLSFNSTSPERELIDEEIHLNEPFRNIFCDEEKYSVEANISVYHENELVAVINGFIFNWRRLLNANKSLFYAADSIDGFISDLMDDLSKSKLYHESLENTMNNNYDLYSCYLNVLYVTPKYRRMGIATYLLENLHDIFYRFFNIHIHCFATCSVPLQPNEDFKEWTVYSDENTEMSKLTAATLMKCGFKQINQEDSCYAIDCSNQIY